jgi:hypothetical protein
MLQLFLVSFICYLRTRYREVVGLDSRHVQHANAHLVMHSHDEGGAPYDLTHPHDMPHNWALNLFF